MNSIPEQQESLNPFHWTHVQRAHHMAKSWLQYFGVVADVLEDGTLVAKDHDGGDHKFQIEVHEGEKAPSAPVDGHGDILSSILSDQLQAIHTVTQALGMGMPTLMGREAARKRNGTYHDHYEDVYLRTTAFSRVPDPSNEIFQKYEDTVRKAARQAFFQHRTIWVAMGCTVTDLENAGRLHLCVFVHNWAYGSDEHVGRRLYSYLKQRYGEWAKLSRKKALNSTCLVEQRFYSTGPEGSMDSDALLHVIADENVDKADEDWDVGDYHLATSEGSGILTIERANSTDLRFWLQNDHGGYRLLQGRDLERIQDGVQMGKVKLVKVEAGVAVEEKTPMARRRKARKYLSNLATQMRASQRQVFSMATENHRKKLEEVRLELETELNRRLAPFEAYLEDAERTEAKFLRQENFNEETKDQDPVAIEKMDPEKLETMKDSLRIAALDNQLDTRTRNAARKVCVTLGLNVDGFRDQLEKNRHNLTEAFVPKAKKEINVETEAVDTRTYTKEETDAAADKMRGECEQAHAKTGLTCPCPNHANSSSGKLNGSLDLSDFGIRVTRDPKTKMPVRANRQSNCKRCRASSNV